MIYKSYEINKIDTKKSKFILFYGKNIGAKFDALNLLKKNFREKLFNIRRK